MNININYPHKYQEKEQYEERFELCMERINGIRLDLLSTNSPLADHTALLEYFLQTSEFIKVIYQLYWQIEDGCYYQQTLEELQTWNHLLFKEILPTQYESSYTNPAWAQKQLGTEYGPLLCLLYTELRGNIAYAFEQRLFYLTTSLELYLEVYNLIEQSGCTQAIRDAIYYYVFDYCDTTLVDRVSSLVTPKDSFITQMIMQADLTDLRYLYYFGEYVSDNELQTAQHLNSLSQAQIDAMASTYTTGYKEGFSLYRIDLTKKSCVNIRCHLGFERMVKSAIIQFRAMNLEASIYRGAVSLIHRSPRGRFGFISTSPNKQYDYDHRLDEALLLDKALADRKLAMQRHAYETLKEKAAQYAGPAVIEVYGETPFTPIHKKEAPEYSKKQQSISVEYQSAASLLVNEYIPGDEVSFTIIAYPIPEIGSQYTEIFDATVEVNTLDTALYLSIQSKIIDALDQGNQVHVTGRGNNKTDLWIGLPALADTTTQTNFENCLADVNIPLGEVFTSPQLERTHGCLHVSQVYLNNLPYQDLTLYFTDGVVSSYACYNFDDETENQKYIKQNLLFNHKTLPIGEFAIGTNTTAYAMGKHFQISHLLPILIAEKTGPHFALGDTCFSHEEDLVTYNPDGKQMRAKENAFSQLRHSEPKKAYFNCHTDITVPYNELDEIIVHCPDGSTIPLIQNGRFVLPGTSELNTPLDNLSDES